MSIYAIQQTQFTKGNKHATVAKQKEAPVSLFEMQNPQKTIKAKDKKAEEAKKTEDAKKAEAAKKAETEKKEKIKSTIVKDMANKALKYDEGSFWGLGEDHYNIDLTKIKDGRKLTFGQLKERYGLEEKILKDYNGIKLYPKQIKEGKGENISLYTPEDLGYYNLEIPATALEKYMKEIGK